MAANAPAVLITLVSQPVMTEYLCVEIVRLERGVVNVRSSRSLKEEKCVMVDSLLAAVKAHEDGHILALLVVVQLTVNEVEMCVVELVGLVEIRDAETEVAKLVNWSRLLLKALELGLGPVLVGGEVEGQLRKDSLVRRGGLTVDKVPLKAINGLLERDALSTTWCIQLVGSGGVR